jgi:hypothetical protein
MAYQRTTSQKHRKQKVTHSSVGSLTCSAHLQTEKVSDVDVFEYEFQSQILTPLLAQPASCQRDCAQDHKANLTLLHATSQNYAAAFSGKNVGDGSSAGRAGRAHGSAPSSTAARKSNLCVGCTITPLPHQHTADGCARPAIVLVTHRIDVLSSSIDQLCYTPTLEGALVIDDFDRTNGDVVVRSLSVASLRPLLRCGCGCKSGTACRCCAARAVVACR